MKRVMAFMCAVLVFLGGITIPTMEVHAAGEEKVYTFNDVTVVTEWGVVSQVSDDGVLDITFDGQYQSQFYNIPSEINPFSISKVTFTVTEGNAADLAFKLHTQEDFDSTNKEGTPVSYGNPVIVPIAGKEVVYFSIMSLNSGSTSAKISDVTFYISEDVSMVGDMNFEAPAIEEEIPNLKDTFVADFDKNEIAGVSIMGSELSDEILMQLVTKHFNAVTLGNELKPDALFGYSNAVCPGTATDTLNGEEIVVPTLDYSRAEQILDYIVEWNKNNPEDQIKVRGHVLVWHSQTPEWFFHEDYDKTKDYVSSEEMNKRLEWYIKTVLTHFTGEDSKYKDLFYGWDVVNEAVSDSTGTYRSDVENGGDSLTDDTHGTKSSWWKVYQSNEFIINAFRYANKYAPADVELYYNDYNDSTPSKVETICELLNAVNSAEGTRIDGMGMQGHYDLRTPTMEQFEAAAHAYADIVGKVQLTELDIKASTKFDGTEATMGTEYTKQAHRYKEIYDSMKKLQAEGVDFDGITIWGVIDPNSWLQGNAGVGGGADGLHVQCPLLFDGSYKAKPAFWAFVDPSKLEPLPEEEIIVKPSMISIPKGTIAVDGEKEEAWNGGVNVPLTINLGSEVKASVELLWDEENLYVYFNVKDAALNKDNEEVHQQDSIEVFIDELNSKSSAYGPEHKQYRINYENALSFNGENCLEENMTSVVKTTDTGYAVEAAFKWTEITPVEDIQIGLELQINDANDSGVRIGTLSWYDESGQGWSVPGVFGTAELTEEVAVAATEPAVEAVAEDVASDDGGVSDTTAAAVAVLLLGGASAVIYAKKKRQKSN